MGSRETLGASEMSRGNGFNNDIERRNHLGCDLVMGELLHERGIFFQFPDSRLEVKSMRLDCFQNHETVGYFR